MTIGQNSGAITIYRPDLSDLLYRAVHLVTRADFLKVSAQRFLNTHSLQVPVSHFSKQNNGSVSPVAFFQTLKLLQHQLQAFVKRTSR